MHVITDIGCKKVSLRSLRSETFHDACVQKAASETGLDHHATSFCRVYEFIITIENNRKRGKY